MMCTHFLILFLEMIKVFNSRLKILLHRRKYFFYEDSNSTLILGMLKSSQLVQEALLNYLIFGNYNAHGICSYFFFFFLTLALGIINILHFGDKWCVKFFFLRGRDILWIFQQYFHKKKYWKFFYPRKRLFPKN